MQAPKIFVVINRAWNIYNFRSGLIRALVQAGCEVVAVAPRDESVEGIEALGARFVHLPIQEHGMRPWQELLLCWRLWRLLRQERPQAFLGYTIKPNTYGSFLAARQGVVVINNISGLGAGFLGRGWLQSLVAWMYKHSLARSARVFFQNAIDAEFFVSNAWVRPEQAQVIPGSGVDLQHFHPMNMGSPGAGLRFLYVGRLLGNKGLRELAHAARTIRSEMSGVEFALLGSLEESNPDSIAPAELAAWLEEGLFEYLGVTDDVRHHVAASDCVVLPSYREGTSRSLLEAMAMAKPVITTDAPGCGHLVASGENGWMCRARSAQSLADALRACARATPEQRLIKGRNARKHVQTHCSEHVVLDAYFTVLQQHGLLWKK
jgi:glycosyltransferase involved in cell wall biosynthesis